MEEREREGWREGGRGHMCKEKKGILTNRKKGKEREREINKSRMEEKKE